MNSLPLTAGPLPAHYLLHVGSWFDGTAFHPGAAWIEIEAGRVARLADLDDPTDPAAQLPRLDLTALSLLPALIDAHVHCYFCPWPLNPDRRATPGQLSFEAEVARGLEHIEEMRMAGLAAARDMGDPKLYNNAIRAALRERNSTFTLQSGGQGLFMPGRYGRFLGSATDPADLAREVDRLAQVEKVDFIKLVPTGIINFNKGAVSAPPSYSTAEIRLVVERAHGHGLKVAAHCSGEAGLDRCIAGGVDFIEHAYFATRDHLVKMRDAGLHWTPTLIPVHVQCTHATLCGWNAHTEDNLRRILDDHYARLQLAGEIGLSVLAGSDAGGVGVGHGGGIIEELLLFHRVYDPEHVLRIATAQTYAALGLSDGGAVAAGRRAQFVLYDRAPALDLNQLRHPRWILDANGIFEAAPPRTSDDPDAANFGLDAAVDLAPTPAAHPAHSVHAAHSADTPAAGA
ncbi:MAG: amidohydrolase family protein [Planctomycetota bacterium]